MRTELSAVRRTYEDIMEVTVAAIGDQRCLWKTDVLNNHLPSNQRSDRTPLVLTYDPLNERIKRILLRKFKAIWHLDWWPWNQGSFSTITAGRLSPRFGEHLRSKDKNVPGFPIAEHFNTAGHFLPTELCSGKTRNESIRRCALFFSVAPVISTA